ncbi:hypothetical protein Hypma_000523 [Hypsizygus marmoreus]|uniref:Uncharacterized protein n=1 Tax=Hypsizygus marmoreus TaxID=39966 RepID=A0A369JA32_HYPMA|nr:hypothetical protein Hypma_000523 [Hypsizygus marmoreus]
MIDITQEQSLLLISFGGSKRIFTNLIKCMPHDLCRIFGNEHFVDDSILFDFYASRIRQIGDADLASLELELPFEVFMEVFATRIPPTPRLPSKPPRDPLHSLEGVYPSVHWSKRNTRQCQRPNIEDAEFCFTSVYGMKVIYSAFSRHSPTITDLCMSFVSSIPAIDEAYLEFLCDRAPWTSNSWTLSQSFPSWRISLWSSSRPIMFNVIRPLGTDFRDFKFSTSFSPR